MDLSEALSIIKEFEGCELTAYQDIVGVWTIGWGTTEGVTPGMTITQLQADQFLENDCNVLSGQITKATRALNNNQYCALIRLSIIQLCLEISMPAHKTLTSWRSSWIGTTLVARLWQD
jgi:GH24 family phage-related lysozyme (muramidase)